MHAMIKPIPFTTYRPMSLLGEFWCGYFRQSMVLFGVLRSYTSYEVVLEDFVTPELQVRFEATTPFVLRASVGNSNDVLIDLLDLGGRVLFSTRVRYQQLWQRHPVSMSRLLNQRLAGYLP